MKKLRKGDPVIVIAGKNKGAISSIASTSGDFVYLKDVNVVKRATKGQGFVEKTLPFELKLIQKEKELDLLKKQEKILINF